MTVTTEIGKARTRKEDARLVTGQSNWTDNIQLPGMAHVAFVRSPMAHARVTRVDVSAARGAPGVPNPGGLGAVFDDQRGATGRRIELYGATTANELPFVFSGFK